MSDFGRIELQDLASRSAEILHAEYALHDLAVSPPSITGGIVRSVIEALEDAGYAVMPRRDLRLMYGHGRAAGDDGHRWFESVTPAPCPEGSRFPKTIRIKGDPDMKPETREALGAQRAPVMDVVSKHHEERAAETAPTKSDGSASTQYLLDANRPDPTRTALPPSDDDEKAFFGGPLPTRAELDSWGDPGDAFAKEPTPDPDPEPAPGTAAAMLKGPKGRREEIGHLLDDVTDEDIHAWRGHESEPAQEVAEPSQIEAAPAASRPGTSDAIEIAPSLDDTCNAEDNMTSEQRDLYRRVAPALRDMAREGYMPTMAEYDAAKPADLPRQIDLLNRLGCKWSDLATWLGLVTQSRHRGPGKGKAAQPTAESAPRGFPEGEDDAEAEPEPAAVPRRVANLHNVSPLPEMPPKQVPPLRGTLLVGPDGLAYAVVGASNSESLAQRNQRVYGAQRAPRNADGRPVRAVASFEDD